VVTTEGGTISRLLHQHNAGWVVPESDPRAVSLALSEALRDDQLAQRKAKGARRLIQAFSWHSVLEPLAEFCRQPWKDVNAKDFAAHAETHSPPDSLGFRLRRKLRRLRGRGL